MDEVMCKFETVEDFTSNKSLNGEFLLGYHCQREAFKKKEDKKEQDEKQVD